MNGQMEFENMTTHCDSDVPDQEEEGEDDPSEPPEPTTCCYCGRSVSAQEQAFDCDSCPHSTCVNCRFIDTVKCILCQPESETTSSASEVVMTSLEQLQSKFFLRKRVNKDHIVDVEISTEEGSILKQMCTICKRVFKKSNAPYHYGCATGRKRYSCVECGMTFVKKNHLESHLNNHYGLKPYKCSEPKCKASYSHKDKLIRHMKSHSKEKTKLMCRICDKLYTTQDILNSHMVKVHSSTKQFKCDQCPRTYKYSSTLRIHRLKHQAKRDYMCEVCGKRYALSALLKLHKRSHVLYHRRPFKCRCGKRFMSRRDKARHELIHAHSNCHDFECSLCNTTFGRKDNLERHMKNFHQGCPPVMKRNGKLVAVAAVAPFNSKPEILPKNQGMVAKTNKVEKQKVIKNDKMKVKLKPNVAKEVKSRKISLKKSTTMSKGKSNVSKTQQVTLKTTDTSTPKTNCKESNEKQSVIVSPQHNIQNRPSVIKSLPHLLPYRILPPDKRFLKFTGEQNKDHSVAKSSLSTKVNHPHTQTTTLLNQNKPLSIQDSREKPMNTSLKISENPSRPRQGIRKKVPKDDALNRCFRVVHRTDNFTVQRHSEDIADGNIQTASNSGMIMRSFDGKVNSYRSRKPTGLSSVVSRLPGLGSSKPNEELRQSSSNMMNMARPVEMVYSTTNSNVGGPSLFATVTDSVPEINHEDNFTGSYTASMGEVTYSSYTPYFDNEYFRDSMNSYDSTVENLIPNDLDVGFQYINEQLGCSEMAFSSESRIIRYVSQEMRVVRES